MMLADIKSEHGGVIHNRIVPLHDAGARGHQWGVVRLEAGLTQVDVAQALSKHQSYISKYETGERRVDFVELLDFARIYQKPIEFFKP